MSTFPASLSLLGLAVLAGVLLLNWWQQYRAQRQLKNDSLATRQEPGQNLGSPAEADAALEPLQALAPAKSPLVFEPLDALIDSIVTLELPGDLYGEALLAAMPDTRRVGGKALMFEALNVQTQAWEYPQAGAQYQRMQLGVQLYQGAHRLNNIDFSEFVAATNQYAEKIHASVELPEMSEELLRAKELEAFAKDHDVEVTLCVTSRGTPWSAGYVQQHAQRLGFSLGAYTGRMVYSQPWEAGEAPQPLFALYFDAQAALAEDLDASALRQIRLSLDVPQVPRKMRPYEQLRLVAIDLAAKMEGYISDEAGRAISPELMENLQGELDTVYDQLDARDLSAGSIVARRLFA